ncbi:cilia- and flagella-associated protein 45 [Arvicola amphibius]|uniref:cilia- and flagella-associated protein 45 n=1 Tax=Arvicola amphibius TaxID=1047088 RepID=UPI001C07FD8E|nr:cilia- and flagella-associated protein 45 [Arvicola amphibius]
MPWGPGVTYIRNYLPPPIYPRKQGSLLGRLEIMSFVVRGPVSAGGEGLVFFFGKGLSKRCEEETKGSAGADRPVPLKPELGMWRKGEVRLGKRYRKFSSAAATSLVKWRSGCFGEEQTRAPEAQTLDPAFCRFPAHGGLTFLDLPQIAPFLPPADRNHGDHRDNTREVCFQDTRMFIDPKGLCLVTVVGLPGEPACATSWLWRFPPSLALSQHPPPSPGLCTGHVEGEAGARHVQDSQGTLAQPLSTGDASSSASTASNRSRNRTRYRTKAVNSEVDESLFGGVKPAPQGRSDSPIVLLRDKHAVRKSLTALGLDHKPETIQLITRDMVRELIVPTEDPSGESLIISPEEFERIKWASQVLTKEELEAKEQAFKKEKEAILEAVTIRKKIMKQKEMAGSNNKKLSDLEEVARERAQNLLQRASKLRMEQEEELKDMSKIILNAKCHAIRDAQILEKQQIRKELEEEEKRLDQMMEEDRQKSLQRQKDREKKRKEERIRGKRHIVEQMKKNEEERSLLAEHREQEKEQMLAYMERLQEEDLQELERRHQEKLKMQAEIKRINDENQRQKAERLAQEKLADQMVMEFTKKKMAREAEFEAEQERLRREKEKEIARLRAMQEKAQDYRAEQDALRAKRNQEVADREWRQKEKENAQKKMETEEKLRKSRLEQVAFKEHTLAVQVQRDRDEFERILRAQREQIEKEKMEQEKKAMGCLQHANELRRQVRENQQKHVQDRLATFEEGRRLKEEAQKRRERIEDIKKQKLEELRATGLPEKYCIEAERKANILPTTSVN